MGRPLLQRFDEVFQCLASDEDCAVDSLVCEGHAPTIVRIGRGPREVFRECGRVSRYDAVGMSEW